MQGKKRTSEDRHFEPCRQLLHFAGEEAEAQSGSDDHSSRGGESRCLRPSASSTGSLTASQALCKEAMVVKFYSFRMPFPRPLTRSSLIYSSTHHPVSSFSDTVYNKHRPVANRFFPSLVLENTCRFLSLLVWMLYHLKLCSVTPKLPSPPSHLLLS